MLLLSPRRRMRPGRSKPPDEGAEVFSAAPGLRAERIARVVLGEELERISGPAGIEELWARKFMQELMS